jgi:hypothetical protein
MTTKRHQILDNLVTVLEGITTVNGYSVDMGEVSREPQHWTDTKRFPAIYTMEDLEDPNFAAIETFNDCRWSVGLLVYVKHRKLLSTEIEKVLGDIKKILLLDANQTLSGLSWLIELNEVRNVSLWLKDIGIFEVDLVIEYRYGSTP